MFRPACIDLWVTRSPSTRSDRPYGEQMLSGVRSRAGVGARMSDAINAITEDDLVPCRDPIATGSGEEEVDGNVRYRVCQTCGFEYAYERVEISGEQEVCAIGVPEALRRAASEPMERAMAPKSDPPNSEELRLTSNDARASEHRTKAARKQNWAKGKTKRSKKRERGVLPPAPSRE